MDLIQRTTPANGNPAWVGSGGHMFDFLFTAMGFFVLTPGDGECFGTPLGVPKGVVEQIFERPNELSAQLFAMCWIYEFTQPGGSPRAENEWKLALRILSVMDRAVTSPTNEWAQLNARVLARAEQDGVKFDELDRVGSRTFPRFKVGHDPAMGGQPVPH